MTIDFSTILPQKTPDAQIETDWTSQMSGQPSGAKKTLLIGHKTSAGTEPASAASVAKPIYSVNDAISKWGKGSDIAVMAEYFLKNNNQTPLYGIAYAEGGTGVQATNTVVYSGTASGAGLAEVWIMGQYFSASIASGNTPTQIGDAITAQINAHSNLPVAAVNTTGSVALTHRTKGTHGNTITYRAKITSGITTTVTCAGAVLASGANNGDASDCLAAIEGDRYHHIVFNTNNEYTASGEVVTHQETQSGPSVQKWGGVILGHCGTQANATTMASNALLDSYRAEVVWHQTSDQPCYVLAAAFAGQRAKCAPNKSLDYVELVGITPQYDETAWPTSAEIEAALAGGVTPLRPLRNGAVQIVRAITTRQSPNAAFLDSSVIDTSDYVDEYILTLVRARLLGRPLKSGSPPASPSTVTPGRVTAVVNEALLVMDTKLDYLQGVQDSIDAGHNFAEINALDANRVDAAFDFWPVAHLHFFAGKKTYMTKMY